MARRDKFVTEIFLTCSILTLLTNTSIKDENAQFNQQKYKKYDKYIQTLIIECDLLLL